MTPSAIASQPAKLISESPMADHKLAIAAATAKTTAAAITTAIQFRNLLIGYSRRQ
jgi:hypothetical protein